MAGGLLGAIAYVWQGEAVLGRVETDDLRVITGELNETGVNLGIGEIGVGLGVGGEKEAEKKKAEQREGEGHDGGGELGRETGRRAGGGVGGDGRKWSYEGYKPLDM